MHDGSQTMSNDNHRRISETLLNGRGDLRVHPGEFNQHE